MNLLLVLTVAHLLLAVTTSSGHLLDVNAPSYVPTGGWDMPAAATTAASTRDSSGETYVSFTGWSATAVKLNNTGIFPAAVALGRYLVIMGGSAIVPPYTPALVFLRQYALPTINVVDITTGSLVLPWMLLHNESTGVKHTAPGRHASPLPPPLLPLPPRVPAQLTFPAVGTATAVRLGQAAYIIGFCTMLPSNVIVGKDDEFRVFLRSVQEVRLYQEEFPSLDDVTMDIRNASLPADALLRFNASCVGSGGDIIYIVGGVSLEKKVSLASVSQYNVVTGQFIEAGLLLDDPIVAPGVFESSGLVFIAGGYRESTGNGLVLSRMVTVIDPSLVKMSIGSYDKAWQLNWLAPQLVMYNHTLAVMGATNGRSFDRQEVWSDLLQMRHDAETVSIPFPPLRSNAALLAVTNVDGVTAYLVGGQVPPPDGAGISLDVFTGKMRVNDGHLAVNVVGFHYISLANEVSEEAEMEVAAQREMQRTRQQVVMEDGTTPSKKVNRRVREEAIEEAAAAGIAIVEQEERQREEEVVNSYPFMLEDSKSVGTYTLSHTLRSTLSMTPTISPSITPTLPPPSPPTPPTTDLPNNDGNITVLVNGYEPLWYNFTFNILLSESLVQACPGLIHPGNYVTDTDLDRVSPCLLRLSDSPTCNSLLLDIGNLSSANTQPYTVNEVDPITNTVLKKTTMAVGPVTLIGSLVEGIINLTGHGVDYGGPSVASLFGEHHHRYHRRRPRPIYGRNTTRPFYEQFFLYVCFSSGAFVLPQCEGGINAAVWDEKEDVKKPCTTAFYRALNAEKPFVLSPVTTWVPGTTTTTTLPPSPAPDNNMSYGSIAALVISIFIAMLLVAAGLFQLLKRYSARSADKTELQRLFLHYDNSDDENGKGHGVGRGTALPVDQKQRLLDGKYHVLHRLGRGSFSVVYLVERVADGQRFALKYVQCADDVDRLEAMRECEVAYTLQGHPNVIRLVDMFMSYRFDTNLHAGGGRQQRSEGQLSSPNESVMVRVEDGREIFPGAPQRGAVAMATPSERYLSLVMAYHEKGDLGKWIRQKKSEPMIPETTIMSIAFQILTVLQFMHHREPAIIHRDLKPENILLESDTARGQRWKESRGQNSSAESLRIVVTDFGLSRVMDKTFCETGVGSLPYVAPECWQRHYSTKVDIWATGCILYAACAKRVESDNVKVMFSECGRPDFRKKLINELTQVYGYSLALAAFITYLLEPDPARRPSAEEALRLIRKRRKDAMDVNAESAMVPLYKDDDNDDADADGGGERSDNDVAEGRDRSGHVVKSYGQGGSEKQEVFFETTSSKKNHPVLVQQSGTGSG
ncbi:protein kinase, partial [Trypanosoma rangeli SC58]